jgi:hypothetical protein
VAYPAREWAQQHLGVEGAEERPKDAEALARGGDTSSPMDEVEEVDACVIGAGFFGLIAVPHAPDCPG